MFILISILLFGALIAVHEFGHFITAKLFGVKVHEFAIGMGPLLLKKQGAETLYSLRLFPIGGYCAMEGEDGESDDPRSLGAQHPVKKIIILAAGATMNFLFGLLLLLFVFHYSAPQTNVITDFMEGCPYEGEQALQVGDEFWEIDGKRVRVTGDVGLLLGKNGTVHDVTVRRDGELVTLEDFELKLLEYDEVEVPRYGFYFGDRADSLGETLRYTWNYALNFGSLVWQSLASLVSGEYGVKDLSGVVGVVDIMNDVGQQAPTFFEGFLNLCYFAAFVAVNLAVMNLLPIPALDGGRIFCLLVLWPVEKIIGHKVDPKYEAYIHSAGMFLLLALMAYVMFNDVIRLLR